MKILKKSNKLIFSYVIGRFSKKVGEKFQHFPIDSWQKDLTIAKKFGFNGVEWIISDYSNPIFNETFLNEIKKHLLKKKLKISSISLDLIMAEPLHNMPKTNLEWLIARIKLIQKKFEIKRITVPIEEGARFKNKKEKKESIKKLSFILKKLSQNSKIAIETDISPKKLVDFLKSKNFQKLGLLVDLGNVRANGYKINEYFNNFKNRIYGFHIKYRNKNHGKSNIIPREFKELEELKKNIGSFNNLQDITFQTFRSEKNYINDMKKSIKSFNEIFSK